MFIKLKNFAIIVLLFSCLTFLNNGCEKNSHTEESARVKVTLQETESFMIPRYELIETPEYKELKQKVEKAGNEVNELETKRAKLLVNTISTNQRSIRLEAVFDR